MAAMLPFSLPVGERMARKGRLLKDQTLFIELNRAGRKAFGLWPRDSLFSCLDPVGVGGGKRVRA